MTSWLNLWQLAFGCWLVLVAAGLPIQTALADAPAPPSQPAAPAPAIAESLAEIKLPAPVWHVVVLRERDSARLLYSVGDVIVDPAGPRRSVTVIAIQAKTLTVRDNHTGRTQTWRIGRLIPGMANVWLLRALPLTELHYRYQVVQQITQREPVLLSLEGSVAVLQKQVLPSGSVPAQSAESPHQAGAQRSAWAGLNPTMSRLTQVKEVDVNTYELEAAAVRPALENVGQVIQDLKLMISPNVSAQTGLGFTVSSALADGVLNQGGFTVTNSKAAQMFGIQMGDTIMQVNHQPVTSPLSAWWAYQEFLAQNQRNVDLQVLLRHDGSLVTKTYRLR